GVSDLLAVRKQKARLEIVKSPFQQLLALVRPLLLRSEAVDHNDETQSVLHGGSHKPISGFFGEPGLEAVSADSQREQRIAIELADLVPGKLPFAIVLVVVGIGLDDVSRQLA